MDHFDKRKHQVLLDLQQAIDRSPKGSVDAPIAHLVQTINESADYCTTSSCSGRISVFTNAAGQRKGGIWALVSHEEVSLDQLLACIGLGNNEVVVQDSKEHFEAQDEVVGKTTNDDEVNVGDNSSDPPVAVFRYEPLILSIECRDLDKAACLLKLAQTTGFRESGITSVSHRYMVSVRSSLRLEVPICVNGSCIAAVSYLSYLVETANKKMRLNEQRTQVFTRRFIQVVPSASVSSSSPSSFSSSDSSSSSSSSSCSSSSSSCSSSSSSSSALAPSARSASSPASASCDSSVAVHYIPQKHASSSEESALIDNTANNDGWALICPKEHAPVLIETLKASDWNDIRRLTGQLTGGLLALPLTAAGAKACKTALQTTPQSSAGLCTLLNLSFDSVWLEQVTLNERPPKFSQKVGAKKSIRGNNNSGETEKVSDYTNGKHRFTITTKSARTPGEELRTQVTALLTEHKLPHRMQNEIPARWEILGDMVVLPSTAFIASAWKNVYARLWPIVCQSLRIQKVARQHEIAPDLMRQSQAELLFGEDGWVVHKENNILYNFDATKCMFSSGNGTEKVRMGKICSPSDVVVDLYAGIGYFTLPFLIHGKVKHVHACEINPNSVEALRRALVLNKIDNGRFTIHPGDNRSPLLLEQIANCADRVSLGLLPSSEEGWPVGLFALKPTGGTLHVHANVKEKDEKNFGDNLLERLRALALASSTRQSWNFKITYISRVKSYGPHVNHLVYDVHAGPHSLAPAEATSITPSPPASFVSSPSLSPSPRFVSFPAIEPLPTLLVRALSSSSLSPAPVSRSTSATSLATPRSCASPSTPSHISPNSPPTIRSTSKTVTTITNPDAAQFAHLMAARQPVIIRGANMGSACGLWTPEYLQTHGRTEKPVSVHVCPDKRMNFCTSKRNYVFHMMPFQEFIARASGFNSSTPTDPASSATTAINPEQRYFISPSERYYFRGLGPNARIRANFFDDFPGLAQDFKVPEFFAPMHTRTFSSVFRAGSANLQLWTHYDITDNILCQVVGKKRVVLYPPHVHDALYLPTAVHSSSSPVVDIDRPNLHDFPLFPNAQKEAIECVLLPGDILYIPALWFHNILSLEFSVGINIFFKDLDDKYYQKKDVYGNQDLISGANAMQKVHEAKLELETLPPYFRAFYLSRSQSILHT